MLIAGALSVIAGCTYLPVAVGDGPNLTALIMYTAAMYTAAGGAFFVIQAATPAWKQRRRARVAQA